MVCRQPLQLTLRSSSQREHGSSWARTLRVSTPGQAARPRPYPREMIQEIDSTLFRRDRLPAEPGPGNGAEFRTKCAPQRALMGRRRTQLASGQSAASLVGGLVLGDDVARNATALADLVAALPSPFPDLRTTLPARPSSRLPPSPACRRPARVIGKCADLLSQFLAVRPA